MIPSWTTEFPCCLLWFITKKWADVEPQMGSFFWPRNNPNASEMDATYKKWRFQIFSFNCFSPKKSPCCRDPTRILCPAWGSSCALPCRESLVTPRQRLIASELDRTPAEIIKKLEEGWQQLEGWKLILTITLPWKRAKLKKLWWKGWRW